MTAASLEAIHFIDQYIEWISCYDPHSLLKTTDGGDHWAEIYDFGEDHIRELVFTDENNGWGISGAKLYKTLIKIYFLFLQSNRKYKNALLQNPLFLVVFSGK